MSQKDALLFYSVKYDGNSERMLQALKTHESYELITTQERYFTIFDEVYPNAFRHLSNPPLLLYYRGDLSLLNQTCVSVIGSRNAIPYALYYTEVYVSKIAKDYPIVSGLARGIDGFAHQIALSQGRTIAILGHGMNHCYPSEHRDLLKEIQNKGLVLTEYPSHSKPLRFHFPQRNRLIAGLGEKLLVMQATLKSGTMITVETALNLGKDIYVLPYRMDDCEGEGCNLLIQQGANLLTSLDDL